MSFDYVCVSITFDGDIVTVMKFYIYDYIVKEIWEQ